MSENKSRLALLREEMAKKKIDMYLMQMSDDHASEYVGDRFKEIAFLTGFTGENTWVCVTQKKSYLWADGRYFIQAKKELRGSGTSLFEMGEEGVPTVSEYIKKNLKAGQVLGFSGRQFSYNDYREYKKIADEAKAKISIRTNLMDKVWRSRPALTGSSIWELSKKYSGETFAEKRKRVLDKMKEQGCDAHLLTSLYDIAWLLNLRADDIACVPVFMSFLYMTKTRTILFAAPEAVDSRVKNYLKKNGIELLPYESIYKEIKSFSPRKVLIDPAVVNATLATSFGSKTELFEADNPTELMRSIKNKTEIANTRIAHIRDGVAVTKFIYYIKHNIGKRPLSELDAADIILDLRRQQEDFLGVSFDTIAGYGGNAAMMHYTATPESYADLRPEGFLLVDSGGHYLQGTTDITRTIALGPLTDEQRHAYTTTVRANLRLASAHFPDGARGENLDILARGPFWDEGLDYRCGTGHGVGHISNVHEGPQSFRWKAKEPKKLTAVLKPGMITTDEPGLYVEDGFGIRIENELLCVEDEKTEYGQYYKFEPITFAPFEVDAINVDELTQYERRALNDYHALVYEKLTPHLTKAEAKWLKKVTKPL
ncbi:MAG: aminopeptidase P family protein [Lachnospiraceae bacterium]|nr:aminopeptidase P family protein [Lachnospiraceae bacterium]